MKLIRVTLSSLLLIINTLSLIPLSHSSPDSNSECKAWLVQSIPTDMPHLSRVPGVLSTADVFRWLAGNSSKRLDILAQYWQLVAGSDDPRSGDCGYSKTDMLRFGANEGFGVYKAIENAADRNVSIRFLQHSGVYPDYTEEPSNLASGRPNVKNVTLLLSEWWGSGIVHAKVWISDHRDVYIGSANNDWKSLTQVKEVGIYLVGCPTVANKVEVYYDNLWKLASLNVSAYTKTIWDQQWQVTRKVPCWSHFIPSKERCRSPLPYFVEVPHVAGYPVLSDPYMFQMPIQTPGLNYSTLQPQSNYLSFAPPELLFGKYQADEQAWVDTIKSVGVGETVRINTMDWLGQSQYSTQTVYWSSLSSAISEVLFSKYAKVKILVAYWTHYINGTDKYLKSLLYSNALCSSSKYNKCSGQIEIRYYVVPGFNLTGPAIQNGTRTGNAYPGYSRVNHGKYVVSNVRAHIGTSNLIWDYFYTTSGVSFGTFHPGIVLQLQEIFDADWNSPYTVPVEPLEEGHAYSS
ncbi:Phospholipase D Y [Camellia lanceoleosa]|uniref:Phospholipase D Y n=1 Tax=Camellia lanceoleosa TaxID=1840588 RepID=A0ACC0FEU0_9ERIC|nr:Phospholipase D Y [Camellia lanceoleosa]